MTDVKYVKDIHGFIYEYSEEFYADMLNSGKLAFCDAPIVSKKEDIVGKLQTMEEISALGREYGLRIPLQMSALKAQQMLRLAIEAAEAEPIEPVLVKPAKTKTKKVATIEAVEVVEKSTNLDTDAVESTQSDDE